MTRSIVAALALLLGCGGETQPGSGFGGATSAATGAGDGGAGGVGGSGGGAAGTTGQGGGSTSFACGPVLKCNTATHYCEQVEPGVQGGRTVHACEELPDSCGTNPTCACVASGGGCMCSGTAASGLTVICLTP